MGKNIFDTTEHQQLHNMQKIASLIYYIRIYADRFSIYIERKYFESP